MGGGSLPCPSFTGSLLPWKDEGRGLMGPGKKAGHRSVTWYLLEANHTPGAGAQHLKFPPESSQDAHVGCRQDGTLLVLSHGNLCPAGLVDPTPGFSVSGAGQDKGIRKSVAGADGQPDVCREQV